MFSLSFLAKVRKPLLSKFNLRIPDRVCWGYKWAKYGATQERRGICDTVCSQLTCYTDGLLSICRPQTDRRSIVSSNRPKSPGGWKKFCLRVQTEVASRRPAAAVVTSAVAPWSSWRPPSWRNRPPQGGPGGGRGRPPGRPEEARSRGSGCQRLLFVNFHFFVVNYIVITLSSNKDNKIKNSN